MPQIRPRADDRRRVLREVTYQTVPSGPLRRGNTLGLSPTGLKLYTWNSLKVGELIALTWADLPTPLTVSGRVVHARVDFDGSCSGTQFVHEMSWADVEALGGRPVD